MDTTRNKKQNNKTTKQQNSKTTKQKSMNIKGKPGNSNKKTESTPKNKNRKHAATTAQIKAKQPHNTTPSPSKHQKKPHPPKHTAVSITPTKQDTKPKVQVNTNVVHIDTPKDAPKKQTNKQRSFFAKSLTFFGKTIWSLSTLLFISLFIGSIVALDLAYPIYLEYQHDIPPLSINKITDKMKPNSIVYDEFDQVVADLPEEAYIPITYEELPSNLIDAIMSVEDARFLLHKGVDGPRTIRAVIENSISETVSSGGSTITQQLVKLTSLKDKIAREGKDYKESNERKVHEWILSYELEQKMSKPDILVAYFNSISYGRYIGVGTAAKRFFNKKVSELTLPEAMLLAGIPQSPTPNNPYNEERGVARDRYLTVIDLMQKHGYIDQATAKATAALPLADFLLTNQDTFTNRNYAYFSGIESELNQIFNVTSNAETLEFIPYYTGYKIFTGMNVDQQNYANEIMNTENVVPYTEMLQNIPYYANNNITNDNNLQAAFTAINLKTGAIPAIGAARNFTGNNFALHGYRSPGSSIKPVIDYAPGIEKFGWSAGTVFQDKKTYYSGTRNEVFNFSNSVSNQSVSLSSAVAQSLNTVAVQAMQKVGVEYAGAFADSIGISKAGENLRNNNLYESAALGGGLETTTTELAAAYAAFGNAGRYNKPHFIRRIENDKGEIIYEHPTEGVQAMSPRTAQQMTNALLYTRRSGTPSSGRKQVDWDITFAAKTGTSSYATSDRRDYGLSGRAEKDHWIVGYSPEYSIAVWTGFNIENAEFLSLTRGNINGNKGYGSYIMAAWMNRFAPTGTDFNFDVEPQAKVTFSSLALTTNYDEHILSWHKPTLQFPISIPYEEREQYQQIVYDIYMIRDNVEEKIADALPSDTTTFKYGTYLKGENNQIKIVARLQTHGDDLVTSNQKQLRVS